MNFPTQIAFDLPLNARTALHLSVNGQPVDADLDNRTTLLDFLREELELTGAKKGCDHGQCGACTVLVDGRRVLSCLKLAVSMDGRTVSTVEGLSCGNVLHSLQRAFIEHDAFQCGFCTSGQLMSAVAVLSDRRCTSRVDIQEQMSGNLCRCGAYTQIVSAILAVKGGDAVV